MGKLEARTIYDKDEVKIQVDKYNWILTLSGKNPSYFGDIEYLFKSLAEQKLKITTKKNFENLARICEDLKKEVSEIGETLKSSPMRIREH